MLHEVRVTRYECNSAGRSVLTTRWGVLDLTEIEYMEQDFIPEYGDCTIVRLRSGKEVTVTTTIKELMRVIHGDEKCQS